MSVLLLETCKARGKTTDRREQGTRRVSLRSLASVGDKLSESGRELSFSLRDDLVEVEQLCHLLSSTGSDHQLLDDFRVLRKGQPLDKGGAPGEVLHGRVEEASVSKVLKASE